jgi:hypothetical protein
MDWITVVWVELLQLIWSVWVRGLEATFWSITVLKRLYCLLSFVISFELMLILTWMFTLTWMQISPDPLRDSLWEFIFGQSKVIWMQISPDPLRDSLWEFIFGQSKVIWLALL